MTKAHVSERAWGRYKAYMRDYMREYRRRHGAQPKAIIGDGPWQRRCACGVIFLAARITDMLCPSCHG